MKKVTTSVLLWDAQAQLLGAAASRKGMNVSEYVREVLVPFAARESGHIVPSVPRLETRHPVVRRGFLVADLARAVAEELSVRLNDVPPHRMVRSA